MPTMQTLSRAKPSAKLVTILDGDKVRPIYRAKLGSAFVAHPKSQKHEFDSEEEAMEAAIAFKAATCRALKHRREEEKKTRTTHERNKT